MAYHKKRFETIIQKLRDNGHKITPQRLAIVKILAKNEGHPSVENIHVQIKKDFPDHESCHCIQKYCIN